MTATDFFLEEFIYCGGVRAPYLMLLSVAVLQHVGDYPIRGSITI